jgi:hypothetical protein
MLEIEKKPKVKTAEELIQISEKHFDIIIHRP